MPCRSKLQVNAVRLRTYTLRSSMRCRHKRARALLPLLRRFSLRTRNICKRTARRQIALTSPKGRSSREKWTSGFVALNLAYLVEKKGVPPCYLPGSKCLSPLPPRRKYRPASAARESSSRASETLTFPASTGPGAAIPIRAKSPGFNRNPPSRRFPKNTDVPIVLLLYPDQPS